MLAWSTCCTQEYLDASNHLTNKDERLDASYHHETISSLMHFVWNINFKQLSMRSVCEKQTDHNPFSNWSIDCKLSTLIQTVSPHFLPAYRERRTGGDVAVFTSKHNIWVSVSNVSPLICIRMFLPVAAGFLQSCQNYIINYGTPVNIVFGTISLKNNLFDMVSTEGNFLSGWHPSVLPCLQWSINLYL